MTEPGQQRTGPGDPPRPATDRTADGLAGLPAPRWGWLVAIGSLLGYVALSLLASQFFYRVVGLDAVTTALLSNVFGWMALAGVPLLASTRWGNGPRRDLALDFEPVDIGGGVLGAVGGLVASFVFATVYVSVTNGSIPETSVGQVAAVAQDWQLYALAAMAVAAAFVEEVHFRGMWWNLLRRKGLIRRGLSPGVTLVATSLLFAAVHFEWQRSILLFALGLILGYLRLRFDRLGPAMVMHACINGIAALTWLSAA